MSKSLTTLFPFLLTENLILTADHKTVKLADFGLAREESLTEMMTAETGTYRWMAPEVLNCLKVLGLYCSGNWCFVFTNDSFIYLEIALQHSHTEARGKEALQSQGGCLQLCNCSVGAHPQ